MVQPGLLSTSQLTEDAFYAALENNDLVAMMAVWSDSEDIVCVHPNGPILRGQEAVRDSWRDLFSAGTRLRFVISNPHYLHEAGTAIHVLHENIYIGGAARPEPPVMATNIYQLTPLGWRMVLHHASISSQPALGRSIRPTRLH